MGRKNKSYYKSLHQQAYDRLTSMQAFGVSKRGAISLGNGDDKIFSFSTYKTYKKHINLFLRWIQEVHPECSTLKSARKYVNEWLTLRSEQTDSNGNKLSAYTLHTETAALGKLYGIRVNDPDRFVPPKRRRCDIKRSRVVVKSDAHFSINNNDALIRFCMGTGCRRDVLERLRGEDLWSRDRIDIEISRLMSKQSLTANETKHLAALKEAIDTFPEERWYLHHRRDKGGKNRFAPIIGPDQTMIVSRMQDTPKDQKVWLHVHSHADIHAYRADYASRVYKKYARAISSIPYDATNQGSGKMYQSEVYCCRGDDAGKKLDRRAMYKCTKALGHNRLSVVSAHYLRGI